MGFDRTTLDQFSLDSHEKAAAAQDSGAFDDQIVGIKDQDGNPVVKDEGIRRGTPMEKMASLKPAFKEDGVIHAGNSSQISDGSAAILFMSAEKAKSLGLKPIAKVTGWGPPADLVDRWAGHAWPSARVHSHLLAALPSGTFPGVDNQDVYEFLQRRAPDRREPVQ